MLKTYEGKRYSQLRRLMAEKYVTGAELAEMIGLNSMAVSRRLNGLTDWTMKDMYSVVDALKLPETMITTIFPRNEAMKKKGAEK